MNSSRRRLLCASAGLAAGAFFGSSKVFASVEDIEKAIAEFAGGKTPGEGIVTLTTPEIAENGNSVPISVSVESPMTEDDHVQSVMILAEGNPNPDVATFHFSPTSGVAEASTRMRLAKTQNVLAVAKLSNGEFYKVSNNVKVTIGGCGG
ncbi:MAG: thiosulfate oxidation carrier protein SoxY [Granulosicoccus sp.]|nr:thiosulfate oxidation carrier protein SoxY [Granulosicoccus sp.]